MFTPENWINLFSVLAWPIVVLTALAILREPLMKFFERHQIKQIKIGNLVATIAEYIPNKTSLPLLDIQWDKTGQLVWLIRDLWRSYATLATTSPKKHLTHGLKGAFHHATELGFDKPFLDGLYNLWQTAHISDESNWSLEKRQHFMVEITVVIAIITQAAIKNQPDFKEQMQQITG